MIELHPAYWWTCDECGEDQFIRPIVEQDGNVTIVRMPLALTCNCGHRDECETTGDDFIDGRRDIP